MPDKGAKEAVSGELLRVLCMSASLDNHRKLS